MTSGELVFMCRNRFYETFIRPALFQLDSETAHHLAHDIAISSAWLLKRLSGCFTYSQSDLQTQIAGMTLANPVGLAAGFDKNGQLVSILGSLGFGFAEIGSITARPSQGNPRPRLFRLTKDEALINRLGLNGQGAEVVAKVLQQKKLSLPIGINIAKTNDPNIAGDAAIADILFSFNQIKNLPIQFITINASCPNTKEGQLTEKHNLSVIFEEIQKMNSAQIPIFVKLSPDSTPELIENIVAAASQFKLAGYVCGNTTTTRNHLKTSATEIDSIGMGGLSGPPLKPLALKLCRAVYKLKSAEQAIIGIGGISTGDDAYAYIRAGASAVEVYTGLVYHGPNLPMDVNTELSELLKRDGLTLSQAIGLDHK
jgi:dihydroorotate dehydrogenase